MLCLASKKDKIRSLLKLMQTGQGEQTKFGRVMNRWKKEFFIFKAIEAS